MGRGIIFIQYKNSCSHDLQLTENVWESSEYLVNWFV